MRALARMSLSMMQWMPAAGLIVGVAMMSGLPGRPGPGYDARTAIGDAWNTRGFTVAVVWPRRDRADFVEGVRMAWEEIDNGTGALAGKVRLRVVDEPPRAATDVASTVVRDPEVVAVLGNAYGEHVVPASLIYEQHSVVYVTPQATDPRSTSHDFQYVFRLTPSDVEIAGALAAFSQKAGYKRVGVIYSQTDHGDSASRQFEARATALGIKVPFERSYHARSDDLRHDFRPLAADVRTYDVDAIMIADELPLAGKLVRDLVALGVKQPLLTTDKLDSPQLREIAGDEAMPQVHVASPFDAASTAPEYVRFRRLFATRFGTEPSYAAAQGYEAFMLIARACLHARSAAPLTLATTMRLAKSWDGLFGTYSFQQAGGVLGRLVDIKQAGALRAAPEFIWKEPTP